MKRLKEKQGITLIALVITIIVLLILAGVAIAMLSGENGILKKAAQAKTKTDEAQGNETKDLQALEYLIKKNTGERCWQYKKDDKGRKIIVTDGTIELSIGTYINYDPTKDENENAIEKTVISNAGSPTDAMTESYIAKDKTLIEGNGYGQQTFNNKEETNGWRLLGIDERTGELLIVSADPVKTVDNNEFYLQGIAGYVYGENELNKICEIFGSGYGATGSRSINVDDINRITGYNPNNVGKYDPEQKGIGIINSVGEREEYGNKVTYKWTETTDKISWKGSNNKTGEGSHSSYSLYGFNWYDTQNKKWNWSKQNISEPIEIATITNNYYTYYPDSLTKENGTTGTSVGLDKSSQEYDMIFKNKGDLNYWLASSVVLTGDTDVSYGMRLIEYDSCVDGSGYLYSSDGFVEFGNDNCGVRPVVSLKSDIKLQKNSNEVYDIVK